MERESRERRGEVKPWLGPRGALLFLYFFIFIFIPNRNKVQGFKGSSVQGSTSSARPAPAFLGGIRADWRG
jgi:hypothetical protein